MVHITVGIYPDMSFVVNGVLPSHLESHIDYNENMRPGRALVIDGKCQYKGSFSEEEVPKLEALAKKQYTNKCSVPYV